MFKFIVKNKNISFIITGLIIILFAENFRDFFMIHYGFEDLILDGIFGLCLVLIGLLYKFKNIDEDNGFQK